VRTTSTFFLIDWIAISARWLFLLGVSLWLASVADVSMMLVLGLAALGNLVITALVVLDRMLPVVRLVSVLADVAIAYLLFWLAGPSHGGLDWVGLLPVFTASLYYQWIGLILVTLACALLQGLLNWYGTFSPGFIFLVGLPAVLYLAIGIPTVLVSRYLRKISRRAQPVFANSRPVPRQVVDPKEKERRQSIFVLISALSSTLNYQKVLETALDLSANALAEIDAPVDRLISAVLLFSHKPGAQPELEVASSRRMGPVDIRLILPGTRGLIGKVIDDGIAAQSKDIKNDPELNCFLAFHDCNSAYCVPLRTGLDAYGVLIFAHPDPGFFIPDRCEVLDIVGNQSVIALQNARLYSDLEQEKNRMIEIQEEARKKMARDLHDGPTQSVSAIAMRVNFARRLMERDTKAASEELFKIEELARRTTKEIRHMLFTLRPLVLESQGLIAALESMAVKIKETYNQEVIIQADQHVVDELEASKQGVVFSIAEEATNNARKHAQAAHIWVRLKLLREGLSLLEIEDDGIGFNVSAVDSSYENRGSLGMINMRERAELVNGAIRIDSAQGRGTRIQVVLPLTEEAVDMLRRGG
jgi:signal transduction histidine kinase